VKTFFVVRELFFEKFGFFQKYFFIITIKTISLRRILVQKSGIFESFEIWNFTVELFNCSEFSQPE
jgi:hypothetical protein